MNKVTNLSPTSNSRRLANFSTSPTSRQSIPKFRSSRSKFATTRVSRTILSTSKHYRKKEKELKNNKLYANQAHDIDFNLGEYYIESKRVLTVRDILVNSFKLSEEKLLFVMKSSIIITDQYLAVVTRVKYDSYVNELRCFMPDYKCNGKQFLKAFIGMDDDLRKNGVPISFDFEEKECDKKSSIILRTTFNYK